MLLPMEGCVYPYRHIVPAAIHLYRRDRLGIAADAVVIAAFVNPMKLSRRCLSVWRDVLARIPRALLALSPLSAGAGEAQRRRRSPCWSSRSGGRASARRSPRPTGCRWSA